MTKRIKLSVILFLSLGGLVFPKETLFLPTYTTDVYEHYYYTTEKISKAASSISIILPMILIVLFINILPPPVPVSRLYV